MSSKERELLEQVIPIFAIDKVKIYWVGDVEKVGRSNTLKKRLLVIGSPGIFLVNQKSFAFQSNLCNSISFYDLSQIFLSNCNLTFSSKSNQIIIRSDKAYKLAMNVYMIRQSLFPTDLLPLHLSITTITQPENVSMRPFPLDTLFFDRTISCIYHLMPTFEKKNQHVLTYIENSISKTILIDYKFLNCSATQPLILSLAYEQDIEHIHLKNIRLADFFKDAIKIISVNRFIKRITLENIDFTDADSMVTKIFSTKRAFKPKFWSFINCNLTTQSFIKFFDNIPAFETEITGIEIIQCITGDMISFFQTIFFNDCFHNLSHITIDRINNPVFVSTNVLELANTSWVLEKHCLNTIKVRNMGIDGSYLLDKLLLFEIGLKYLDISGNNVEAALQANRATVKDFKLSNCRITENFLVSFFKLVEESDTFKLIDLSAMKISEDDLINFFKKSKNAKYPSVETLIFSENKLNEEEMSLFADFIGCFPKLKKLCLDDCLIANNLEKVFDSLSNLSLLSDLSLKASKSDESLVLGDQIVTYCMKIKSLKSLDLTNQSIGSKGLEIIMQSEDHKFDELYFDGSNSSLDVLFNFCNYLLKTKIRHSLFPENDFKQCFSSSDRPSDYSEQRKLSNDLKEQFTKRFPLLNKSSDVTFTPTNLPQRPSKIVKSPSIPNSGLSNLAQSEDYANLVLRPQMIQKILDECLWGERSEPIVVIAQQQEELFSLDKLIDSIN